MYGNIEAMLKYRTEVFKDIFTTNTKKGHQMSKPKETKAEMEARVLAEIEQLCEEAAAKGEPAPFDKIADLLVENAPNNPKNKDRYAE